MIAWTSLLLASLSCDLSSGPPGVTLFDGSLGAPVPACPRTSAFASAGGHLLADPDRFYGDLRAALELGLRLEVGDRASVFVELEAVRFQTVLSSLTASSLSLGFTGLGATWLALDGEDHRLSLAGRLVLPTAIGRFATAWPLSLDLGVDGDFGLTEWLVLGGRLGLVGSVALGGGPVDPRLGLSAQLSLEARAGERLRIALGGALLAGFHDPLDHAALTFALRFAASDTDLLELALAAPLLGEERETLAASLAYLRGF